MSQEEQQEKNDKRIRGKAPETLLTEALENLARMTQSKTAVEPERLAAQRTLVIAYKDMVSDKRADTTKKLKDELKAAQEENAALTAKLAEVPPDAAEKIKELQTQNADLKQRLMNQTPIVKEVVRPDPTVLAENAALKDAVAHFVKGWSRDMKVDAILELFEENRTTAKVVTEVFCVCRWEDIVSLMAASDEMLKTHERAYKSPLAPLALSIRLRRQQKESQAQWDKNQEKPPILPVEVARELEQKIATENEVRERNAALKAKIDKILADVQARKVQTASEDI